MKVLQINKLFYPHIGGIEKVVYDLGIELQSIVDMNVLVTGSNKVLKEELVENIKVYRVPSIGTFFSMPVAPFFPYWLRKIGNDMDILHFHYPFPLGDISYLLSGCNKKTIVTWHSEIVKQERLVKYYKPILLKFLNKVDKIIVTSPNLLENSEILERFHYKCEVVPLGIDLDNLICKGNKVSITNLEMGYKGSIILFVGRLVYYKGVEYLIESLEGVEEDFHLLIVGSGPLQDSLIDLTNKKGLSKKVSFLGNVSDERLKTLYSICDFLVLPSIEKSEAYGLVQVEAMAFGKPVISTNLPTGVPFVNQNNVTGIIVPPKDKVLLQAAIKRLMNNPDLKIEYGNNARQRAHSNFSRKNMAKQVYSIYNSLL